MAGTGAHRGFGFVDFVTKQDAKVRKYRSREGRAQTLIYMAVDTNVLKSSSCMLLSLSLNNDENNEALGKLTVLVRYHLPVCAFHTQVSPHLLLLPFIQQCLR